MLHCRVIGGGKPLVLFHGWGFDHRIWLSLIPYLQAQYCVYLVDLPGFGNSSGMSWDAFKQILMQRLPDKFAVVGWSMGGLFAMRLASEEPEHVVHLINISASPKFVKVENWPGVEEILLRNFYTRFERDPGKTLAEFVKLQIKNLDENSEFWVDSKPVLNILNGLQVGLDILLRWDLRQALKIFTGKMCFMFGRRDAIVPWIVKDAIQQIYPNSEYIVFNKAAHIPFLSHRQEFVQELNRVLSCNDFL